jgi:hypothetical protein
MSAKSDAAVRNKVKEIVPEYSPKDGNGTGGVSVNPEPTAASLEILRTTMALR